MNHILTEMAEVRTYASLIHRARKEAGFKSVKYPLTDVKINRYFLPEYRQLLAEECNLVGYLDIPPVEFEKIFQSPLYFFLEEGGRKIWLYIGRSTWQENIYEGRKQQRDVAAKRKEMDL